MRSARPAMLMLLTILAGACTTGTDALDPTALRAPPTPLAGAQPPMTAPQPPPPAVGAVAVPPGQPGAGAARIVLATFVGAPTAAAAPLAQRLGQRGPEKRFAVVPSGDAGATHTLKGFFSTSPEGRETVVFYVWDVVDTAGNRVHRFSGQVSTPGGQGWVSVTDETMQRVADQTAEALALWINGRAG